MSVIAIIQARMGATRLPGKVLADIAGTTLLERVIQRVAATRGLDGVLLATTDQSQDDELEDFVTSRDLCPVYRGSMHDVLDRYYQCARRFGADVVVRVTADDPLKDSTILERAIAQLHARADLDYCSNTLEPTYPEGLDIEAFRFIALERAWREARLPSEREHVTPYIWTHPELFRVENFRFERDLSSWRWTVDKPSDLEFMRAVFGHFASEPLVSFRKVIEWLELNPQIRELNTGTLRNEGYLRSIASEK
jgi:spore coat polysaccharide biosynthesis protein SpsF